MIQLKSSFEGDLVNYYDMFFLEDIVQKANYLENILKKVDDSVRYGRCIDVGCGTGAYAWQFAQYCQEILAIDISSDMIKYAEKNHKADNISYVCADITKFRTAVKCKMALALSHVIGYQIENSLVEKMLININKILEMNGLFIFNFYNEPALFLNRMESKFKKVENEHTKILRFSNATIQAEENVVMLDYYYIINDLLNGIESKSIEIHEKMRYFSVKEMEYYLEKTGFQIEELFHYGTYDRLLCTHWNAGVVVRKIWDVKDK